jgi:hypothetical protein
VTGHDFRHHSRFGQPVSGIGDLLEETAESG